MNSQNSKNHNNFQYHYGNRSKYINLNNIYRYKIENKI